MSLKLAAVVFAEVLFASILRQYKPEFVPVSVLGCCVLVASLLMGELLTVADAFTGLLNTAGVETETFTVLFKVLGSVLVTQFAADTARENEETALAGYIEFAGRVLAVSLALPVFRALLQSIAAMVESA